MVTILRPRRRKPYEKTPDMGDENLPEDETIHQDDTGTELSHDEDDIGTASDPGEGPNPTA